MSLTAGIEIWKKEWTSKTRPENTECVSWKNRMFHAWFLEWIGRYAPEEKVLESYIYGPFEQEVYTQIEPGVLRRIAEVLIDHRLDVCDGYHGFIDAEDYPYAEQYGRLFMALLSKLQEGEMLVYYNCGD